MTPAVLERSAPEPVALPMLAPPPSGRVGSVWWKHARAVLEALRGGRERPREVWLQHALTALAEARATFASDRAVLPGFEERYLLSASSQLLAVNAVALRLFAEQRREHGFGYFGACLEVAALVCGTHIDDVARASASTAWGAP